MKIGDIDVARIGLGTNRLTKTRDNVAFITAAVAAGVQMIDTAYSCTGGQSEETIGEALSPFPDDCVVATKGGFGGAGHGRPEVLRAELEQSLRQLRTDSISLYYLHRVDPATPIEESLTTIKEYRDQGRIRYVGLSEVEIDQIERARRVVPIAAVQNHYNLSERKYEGGRRLLRRRGHSVRTFLSLAREWWDCARRDRHAPSGDGATGHACVAPSALASDVADSWHPIARSFEAEPGGVEDRTHQIGGRGAPLMPSHLTESPAAYSSRSNRRPHIAHI